jgi:hypothetical protein
LIGRRSNNVCAQTKNEVTRHYSLLSFLAAQPAWPSHRIYRAHQTGSSARRLHPRSSLDLKTRTVDHPAAETTDRIEHGVPVTDSIASTIMLRNVVPPDED